MATNDGLSTPQEQFWAGEFGVEYMARNDGAQVVAANVSLFAEILRRAGGVGSILEIGANRGLNVQALRMLGPDLDITALEINPQAAEVLRRLDCTVVNDSILRWKPEPARYDMVFTKGVLIHIDPSSLDTVYDAMASGSRRWVMMAEYFNPTPVTLEYRGEDDRLFKRDFAGDFLDRHPEFELADYGFRYRRDPFAEDDYTWFLMRRTNPVATS